MRTVDRSALVPYSAEQMYALVEDVESYPAFLPWCTGARLIRKEEAELEAAIGLGLGALQAEFSTRNQLQPPTAMTMDLLDGPFRSLSGRWDFSVLGGQGCEARLQLHFEFEHRTQDLLFGAAFEKICSELVDAFVKRAKVLYD